MKYAFVLLLAILLPGSASSQGSGNPTDLAAAARSGKLKDVQRLLAAGARVNAVGPGGKTALMEAAEQGRADIVNALIAAGADLDLSDRGVGTALEAAEQQGHTDAAEILRRAGARTSGRSVGDTVCVRPWKGEGYCGVVEAIEPGEYRLRITEVVGCREGCAPRPDCSAARPVGSQGGLRVGDSVRAASSCLTHTGVRP